MSKKKKKPKISNTKLEVGKFYNVHDQSEKGHPGRIEKADEINDQYLAVTTRSLTKEEYKSGKWKKQYVELNVPTSKDVYKSILHKKPFKGSRLDFGNKEFTNLKIHKTDEKKVAQIKNKKPRLGVWFKKKKASQ